MIMVSADVVPLIWVRGLPDSCHSVCHIDIEVPGRVMDVAQYNLTVSIELDCMNLHINFIHYQICNLCCQDSCTQLQSRDSVRRTWSQLGLSHDEPDMAVSFCINCPKVSYS